MGKAVPEGIRNQLCERGGSDSRLVSKEQGNRKVERDLKMITNKEAGFNIVPLPKKDWQGTIIPMRYTTSEYYDVAVDRRENGFQVTLEKKEFDKPVSHTPEEYDFPDKLYQEHWEKACAWGVLEGQEMIACIETCPEEWSNRLTVTELWVHEDYRRQGIAHALMAVAKEQARLERRRALILETQSCNVGAIDFYLKEGFTLIGFDSCCYQNGDLERKEVRLDLGILRDKKPRLCRDELEIRREREPEYHDTEEMTMRAFWNKHHRGCNEHLLVHKLRDSEDYLPELSRVAVKDGRVIGGIFYSRAWLKRGEQKKEILTFGPLCVDPDWQGTGVGEMLLQETMTAAREAGYPGIVILGEPDYYPLRGFVTCDRFGITTPEGKNFDAFMGVELVPGALSEFGGSFYESEIFEQLSAEEEEVFSVQFPPLEKQYFPMQWD